MLSYVLTVVATCVITTVVCFFVFNKQEGNQPTASSENTVQNNQLTASEDSTGYEYSGTDDDSSDEGTSEAENETDDILNITRPTSFKVYYDGKLSYTYILYTDGTCIKKEVTNNGKGEYTKNGEWRLLEKSIHDENFRVILAWTDNVYWDYFTSDNIHGMFPQNRFDDIDEVLLRIKQLNDKLKNKSSENDRFEVSYDE